MLMPLIRRHGVIREDTTRDPMQRAACAGSCVVASHNLDVVGHSRVVQPYSATSASSVLP